MSIKKTFGRNNEGATLVEFSLLFPLLLLLTFGILEFANYFWQYQRADYAAQVAARMAVTRATFVGLDDCLGTGSSTDIGGTKCSDISGSASWSVTCTGTNQAASCVSATYTRILQEVQVFYPSATASNLRITASGAGLGFKGLGRPVPLVTVELTGLQVNFIALNAILGLGPVNLPNFTTSLPGEDLSGA